MDGRLFEAAKSGDCRLMKELVAAMDPSILLRTTPQGNTCLHISTINGHEEFCQEVLMLDNSLLTVANSHGETPLLTAVTNGRTALASVLLRRCCEAGLREAILKQDENGCNALHHAIRNGHRDLALELIAAEAGLSQGVNKYRESPMYIAVMRDFTDIFRKLLGIPGSAHVGCHGRNALHAAVRNGNPVIAKELVEKRPGLAREFDDEMDTPMHHAAMWGKTHVLGALLQYDWSLGVSVARELVHHCPDAPYYDANGCTCLHQAAFKGHLEFVEFILESPYLRKLVNMRDNGGNTALHYAVQDCNPRIVAALLSHGDTDVTVLNYTGNEAVWQLGGAADYAKTLNWIQNPIGQSSKRENKIKTSPKADDADVAAGFAAAVVAIGFPAREAAIAAGSAREPDLDAGSRRRRRYHRICRGKQPPPSLPSDLPRDAAAARLGYEKLPPSSALSTPLRKAAATAGSGRGKQSVPSVPPDLAGGTRRTRPLSLLIHSNGVVPSLSLRHAGETGGRGGDGLATPVGRGSGSSGERAVEKEQRRRSGEGTGGVDAPLGGEGRGGEEELAVGGWEWHRR
ncbi:hypothetical protein OsJ_33532 [Oryza sativa Japonica Group]|uniref:Uncharacterized protein n=1 Tax=Oryza sativa subsp. japonica TaxID=39947 RepID=B9GA66_ORYSJ|nr:hypothetical protein OsJ_33532 [Oryza sativa Japonica Group]